MPADGVLPSVIVATLRDGAGNPVPGRTVQASTTRGSIVAGGITDVTGKANILLTSNSAGDADVKAWVEQPANPCDLIRRASTKITFTPLAIGGELAPNAESPYVSSELNFGPQPVRRGVPLTVTVRLRNTNSYPLLINGVLGIAQSGIGLTFGPIAQWEGVRIEAGATLVLEAPYTPIAEGHFCFRFGYSWLPAGSTTSLQGDCGFDPVCNWNAFLGRNTDSAPASTNSDDMRKAFGMEGNKKVNWNNYGEETSTQNKNEEQKESNRDWRRRIDYTRELNENMKQDPPRQDYNLIATPLRPPLKTYVAGDDGLTAQQAAALNELLDALTDSIALAQAILISEDRYSGAAEAGNQVWMAQQTSAILHYRKQLGDAYIRAADAADQWLSVYSGDIIPTLGDVSAAQSRLSTSGFTAEEIARYKEIGFTDAQLESLRQAYITADPVDKIITMREELADFATGSRTLGNLLANPPATFSQQTGSTTTGMGLAASSTANLAGVYDTVRTMQVGNPLTSTATINLMVRRLGMPADWGVMVSPSQLTLAPGEQQTVTVRISPSSASVQGTTPRVAVEGYANGELLGGVEYKIQVPTYAPFRGVRVFLPVVTKNY